MFFPSLLYYLFYFLLVLGSLQTLMFLYSSVSRLYAFSIVLPHVVTITEMHLHRHILFPQPLPFYSPEMHALVGSPRLSFMEQWETAETERLKRTRFFLLFNLSLFSSKSSL